MNGVARAFWAEVYDVQAPPHEDRWTRPVARAARQRKLLVRRPARRPIRRSEP